MLVRHDGEPGTIAARAAREPAGDRRDRRSAACTCIRSARARRRRCSPTSSPRRSTVAERRRARSSACEHNAPGHRLLVEPDDVEALLDAVPGPRLRVGRQPHAIRDVRDAFLALRERITLVHVSDTPLPETNHHLPLGRGTVDFAPRAGPRRAVDPRDRRPAASPAAPASTPTRRCFDSLARSPRGALNRLVSSDSSRTSRVWTTRARRASNGDGAERSAVVCARFRVVCRVRATRPLERRRFAREPVDTLGRGADGTFMCQTRLLTRVRLRGPLRPAARGPAPGRRTRPCTTRSTFSRVPSTTGCRPPSSRRERPTRPADAHDLEAEVGEEVLREHRLVHAEALVARLALRIAVRERLEARARRGRAPRRSPPGRATAAPTGSTGRRGTRT